MKITSLNYYVKFVFSSNNESYCVSTTDRNMLNHVKYHNSDTSPQEYKIGDIINFEPDDSPFKIIDIYIRQIVEDTDVFNYGYDSLDCMEQQGEPKNHLFTIQITIERVLS